MKNKNLGGETLILNQIVDSSKAEYVCVSKDFNWTHESILVNSFVQVCLSLTT